MGAYEARLRMLDDTEPPLGVEVDLTDERLTLRAGDTEVADWSLNEIRVSALMDGFHVRAEGEEVILDVTEDARFALDLGLRNAHPTLRRRMSALMRDDA
jgi:hypothetical protein